MSISGVEWFQDAIIYHIFIDRFSRGKEKDTEEVDAKKPVFCGGNIRGIIERLDYIEDLGANTIWLSPFNSTSAYHGYHITDFFEVDERFGTREDIKELIQKAKERKIRMIMDFVPNHCSYKHPYFKEAQKDKNSSYYNWFYFNKWPEKYLCFLSFKELPKLNLDYPPVKNHIIEAAKHWLDFGFDGFRLDHVIGPSHDFWEDFRREIKKDFPKVVLVGEICGLGEINPISFKDLRTVKTKNKFFKRLLRAEDWTMRSYVQVLDGALDFTFQGILKKYMNSKKTCLESKLKKHYDKFPKNFLLPNFLDNHDMNRFLFEMKEDKEKLKKAARIQFAQSQPVIIYYGTEVGLSQKRDIASISDHGDLEARKMMPWDKNKQDGELLEFYKKLILEKKQNS
jgi:glycosidase